jgi:hypothetical protein
MAKVRIQARSADSEDSTNNQYESHRHKKPTGALDILARVRKREGFVGWYQVIIVRDDGMVSFLTPFFVGNASADHESGPFTGFTFHVERTIRALGACYYDSCGSFVSKS